MFIFIGNPTETVPDSYRDATATATFQPNPPRMTSSTFLTAHWRNLIMVNYIIDPKILRSYLPNKTELDLWEGNCYISLVGFMFENTRVMGIKFPFHINFEEVNLRFYVIHQTGNEQKRGVVFIKEFVPKFLIAATANFLYDENYSYARMRHEFEFAGSRITAAYFWQTEMKRETLKIPVWNKISVIASAKATEIKPNSEAEFITEHYWGYAKRASTNTVEYQVTHPPWKIFPVELSHIEVNFEKTYGKRFAFLDSVKPSSVFLADGSDVKVFKGQILK